MANEWIEFVKKIKREKGLKSYKEALKEASNLRKGEKSHSHDKGRKKRGRKRKSSK